MIDGSTQLGARILERLRQDRVIWMTTVGRGAPQSAPVWFLYDRGEQADRIIVYTRTDARRLANLRDNPHIAFNFNCTPNGEEVHVIRGRGRIALELPAVLQCEAYMNRYRDWVETDEAWGRTFEGFAAQYSVPIEITELATWGW